MVCDLHSVLEMFSYSKPHRYTVLFVSACFEPLGPGNGEGHSPAGARPGSRGARGGLGRVLRRPGTQLGNGSRLGGGETSKPNKAYFLDLTFNFSNSFWSFLNWIGIPLFYFLSQLFSKLCVYCRYIRPIGSAHDPQVVRAFSLLTLFARFSPLRRCVAILRMRSVILNTIGEWCVDFRVQSMRVVPFLK